MRDIVFRGRGKSGWVEGSLNLNTKNRDLAGINGLPVERSTVGQYIGIRDKAGRKIFEGDIVRHGKELYPIGYIEQYARFGGVKDGIVLAMFSFSNSEVVGNIHDNPELLSAANGQKRSKQWTS